MSVLRLGSFNVAAQAMSWQRETWTDRQPRILASVEHYGLDVLCIQENGSPTRTRQLTNTLSKARMRRAPGGARWKYIYFNNEMLRHNDSGLMKLNRLGTKRAAWAKLTVRETDETFFITSPHLSASFLGTNRARRAEARTLLEESARLNPNGHPTIHAGDFNSPSDVTTAVMTPAGYFDALRRANTSSSSGYNSFNGRKTVKPGRTQKLDGVHLDHIYVSKSLRNRVVHWSQRPSLAASDHNLIMVKVAL